MTATPSLKSAIIVESIRRLAQSRGAFVTVMEKGDEDAGAVLVLRSWLDGRYKIFSQTRNMDGELGWRSSKPGCDIDYEEVQAYISRQKNIDPDIWLVEIEDKSNDLYLTGPVFDDQ